MDELIPQVEAVLLTTAGRWLSLAERIPAALLARPAAPGEWSALDCLRHLLDTEVQVFPARVRAFVAGQDIAAFDPETQSGDYAGQSGADLAATFARRRAENLAALEAVSAADLQRVVQHSELGAVTLAQMLHEWAAHDLMHTVQAERALMQPFVAGSGPWRPSFSDHDLGGEAGA
ncbi:MAG TPA: DinB family protein [Chloroflexia bacterium]|nr:DinB family protein [Chloroflexia bacterium]